MNKIISMIIVILALLTALSGCEAENVISSVSENTADSCELTESTEESEQSEQSEQSEPIIEEKEDDMLKISFPETEDGYGISISSDDVAVSETRYPVQVKMKPTDYSYDEKLYNASYKSFTENGAVYTAISEVETEGGTVVKITDTYTVSKLDIELKRRTEIVTVGEEAGFADVFKLTFVGEGYNANGFDYFIPGIVYKDTDDMKESAVFSDLNHDKIYVKETRSGLPMIMMRNKRRNISLSLARINPRIMGINIEYNNNLISNSCQFGSIGCDYTDGVSVAFCYPCTEYPVSYGTYDNVTRIYHKVSKGNYHEYGLNIFARSDDEYTTAMRELYMRAFSMTEINSVDVDLELLYENTIDIFKENYVEYEGSYKPAGFNFQYSTVSGIPEGNSMQMGFIGQNTGIGYQLIRYGIEKNDSETLAKGTAIIDFWCKLCMAKKLPYVWWEVNDNYLGGIAFVDGSKIYPVFLRCLADGMEGIANAYAYMKSKGVEKEQWLEALIKTTDNLVSVQNSDGSFYRAYDAETGVLSTNDTQEKYKCSSKKNTPIAVRYIALMYEITGDAKYRDSALKAANYSYNRLYYTANKFVGGTPDNPGVVDKEAAVYAMYCFNAAYDIADSEDKKQKYLEAAEFAAVCALSWTYVYDFRVLSNAETKKINPFSEGGTTGFSIIAVGHSGADCYMTGTYDEFYKMYKVTGDSAFYKAALMLQNNTKSVTDIKGKLGYKYPAMSVEATTVANFWFSSAAGGVWLPWIGYSNISPITKMKDLYGNSDIEQITE